MLLDILLHVLLILSRDVSTCMSVSVPEKVCMYVLHVLLVYRDAQPLTLFTCVNGVTSVEWKPPVPDPSKKPVEFVTMNGNCVFDGEIEKVYVLLEHIVAYQ